MILRDSFYKYLPTDEPGGEHIEPKLDPAHLERVYKKLGMDIQEPSLYSMVCWMAQISKENNSDGIDFDQFIQQAIYFFSQRHHDEGIRYIFELFDKEKRGYLTITQLEEIFKSLDITVP